MTIQKPEPMQSVWNSVESYCLCRDFKYDQYLEVHAMHSKAKPASPQMYADLGGAFYYEIIRSYDEYPVRSVTDNT